MSERVETELGLLPSAWTIKKVDEIKEDRKGSIAMGPFGSDIKTENFVLDGVPIIRGNNLNDFIFGDTEFVYLTEEKADSLKNSICYHGDIIFTHRGTIGQVGIIPQDSNYERYVVSQSGMKLTINKEIVSPEFVHLFFKSRVGQYILLRNKSQVGVPAIGQPTTSLKEMIVPIPPKTESDEIAKTILSIQNKITLLRQQNQDLEELAQTLFKRWFVEFEFPNENGDPYRSSGGKMVESELGEIPEGWRVGCLGDEFTILMGQSPAGSSYNEIKEGKVFYQGRTDFGFRFPSNRLYTTEPKRIADELDVLVSVRAPVGDVNMASEECCIGRGLGAVKSDLKSYCFNKIKSLKKAFDVFENEGTVFGSLSKNDFISLEVIVPDKQITEKYDQVVIKMDLKIFENSKEIQTLTQLRDTLLPKLMSGELRVQTN